MKKLLLALSVLLALIFTSCDAFIEPQNLEKPNLYFVGIGLDYRTWNRASLTSPIGASHLSNTRNDLQAITAQFENLAKQAGYDYRFVTYDDFQSRLVKLGTDPTNTTSYKSEYKFTFTSWNSDNPENKKSITYEYGNIATTNSDGTENNVSLKEFALDFTAELNNQITENNTRKPGKNDIIIFYYTGHGLENGLGPAIYYQTGIKEDDPGISRISEVSEGIKDNYIIPLPYLYLEKMVFSQYESSIVTLFDCCYSGYAIDNSSLGSIHNFKTNSWNNTVRDDVLLVPSIDSIFTNTYLATFSKEDAPKNVYHVTAAHATQTSFDKDFNPTKPEQEKFGAFTYQVLDYLDYDFAANAKSLKNATSHDPSVGCVGNAHKKVYSVTDLYSHIFNNIGYDTKTYATPNVTRSRFDLAFFIM